MPRYLELTPQLPVADVVKSQEYYRDVLGFEIGFLWEDSYGAVSQGDLDIFFSKYDRPHLRGTVLCIIVDDPDRAYEELRSRGAQIVDEIETKPWRVREFTVRDPNGHLLRMGHGV